MALAPGLAPGQAGWLAADDQRLQNQAHQMAMVRGLMDMQNQSQMFPLQRQQLEMQIAKAKRDDEMSAQLGPLLANAGSVHPDVLDAIGMKASLGNHPGAATIMKIADARRQQMLNQQAVQGMQSAPGVVPNTPNDDSGNPMPAIAARPGITDSLANSKYVGPQAQALQSLINQGAPGMNPQQIQSHLDRLTQMHVSGQGRDDTQAQINARQDRAQQGRVEIRNMFPPQERMVPVQQPDGSVVYTPQSQAAGQVVGKVAPPQNNSKQVQALGQAFERAKVNEASATLGEVESLIAKNPKFLEYVTGPKALIPDAALGPEVTAGRQAFAKLFNITLKDRSGAAVTVPEYARLKEEYGKGLFRTPDQLATAVNQARTILNKHAGSVAAGFTPETVDAYNSNLEAMGGSPIVRANKAATSAPAKPQKGEVRNGYEYLGGDPASQMSWRLKK